MISNDLAKRACEYAGVMAFSIWVAIRWLGRNAYLEYQRVASPGNTSLSLQSAKAPEPAWLDAAQQLSKTCLILLALAVIGWMYFDYYGENNA